MNKFEAHKIAWQGQKLTKAEAADLEAQISTRQADINARIRLLGYYFGKTLLNREIKALAVEHVIWIVDNCPEEGVLSIPDARITYQQDDDFQRISLCWDEQLKLHSNNPIVLKNAASFFLLNDRVRAIQLLEMAKQLDPANCDGLKDLAFAYQLGIERVKDPGTLQRALEVQREVVASTETSDQIRELVRLATVAFYAGELQVAKESAENVIEQDKDAASDSVHRAREIVGLVCIEQADIEGAKCELSKLMGHHSDFELANALLQRGETTAVCDHLLECNRRNRKATAQIFIWRHMINVGKKPVLKRTGLYVEGLGIGTWIAVFLARLLFTEFWLSIKKSNKA